MKHLTGLAIALIILGGAFFYLAIKNFENYPTTFILSSSRIDKNNEFLVNGENIGNAKGGCFTIRHEKKSEIILKNGNKEEKVIIFNKSKLQISESYGYNLGMEIINANDKPELRKQFKCNT